jgi:hypothetical protein
MIIGVFKISENEMRENATNEFWTVKRQVEDVIEMAS